MSARMAPVAGSRVAADAANRSLLSESAYDALRSMLVRNEIMPGERLNEAELRETLGVGLTPVREAIRRLEFDKLVVIYPRSGTFAADIALRPSRAITELRLPLEELAARLATRRGSRGEKDELRRLADAQHATEDLQETIDLDSEIHRSMYAMTRNEYLADGLDVYLSHALRQWYYCAKVVAVPDWSSVDNRPLAIAISDGDEEEAAAHIREHVLHDAEQVHGILTAHGL